MTLLFRSQAGSSFHVPRSSLEPVEFRRIVHQYALPRRVIRRPFPEQVEKLYRAHFVLERKMREIAAPDQTVGGGLDERARHRHDIRKIRSGRHAVDARQLHPAAALAVPRQGEEVLESLLLDA